MGRGRRMDRPLPGRDPARPLTTSRQNSTVSASRGADGRIEIAAEPARVPSVTRPSAVLDAAAPAKLPAAKPALLPVQNSPTSPLLTAAYAGAAATSSTGLNAQHPGQTPVQAEPRMPAAYPSTSAAEHAARPAIPPAEATTVSLQHQASAAPPDLHPHSVDVPLINVLQSSPAPRSPSASSGAPLAQHAPEVPAAPRQPHVLPNMATANGNSSDTGAPQVPPQAAPLQQAPAFKPKAVPAPGVPVNHLPNGYGPPQQSSGSQPGLPGLNGRSRSFTPQQPHIMQQPQLHLHLQQQQQQQQQQLPQQMPRRQLEKPGQMPYSLGPDPRQLQSQGMPLHMLAGASAGEQAQSLAGQGRVMQQPQPGASRSSSIGQKRPMPNQDMPHHAPPHQLASPQQQRGPHNPSGPPMMPFNAPMMPFLSSPNGMLNGSMPQGANGMPFLMQGSPRPGMMSGMPLMNPLNLTMGKSAPMHQHGGPPYGANPYIQMQHMPNHITPRAQTPQGPPQMHSGPQPQHIQTTGMHGPAFIPAQRSSSGTLPNGHLRVPSQTAALSPASSLGNSAKGSSTLRATAVPFIPGGVAQPPSPLAAAHSTPAGGPHVQLGLQGAPRQAGAGVAMAAPFYPSTELAGESALMYCAALLCVQVP